MAFMEKLGNMAKTIGEKAGDMIEMNDLESTLSTATTAYTDSIRKIGEYYCEVYRTGGAVAPEIEEVIRNAVERYETMISTQKEINRINEEKAAKKAEAKEAKKEEKAAAKEAKKAEKAAKAEEAAMAAQATEQVNIYPVPEE